MYKNELKLQYKDEYDEYVTTVPEDEEPMTHLTFTNKRAAEDYANQPDEVKDVVKRVRNGELRLEDLDFDDDEDEEGKAARQRRQRQL